jgi:hypothetical protein
MTNINFDGLIELIAKELEAQIRRPGGMNIDGPVQAFALLSIAADLRWFREQMEAGVPDVWDRIVLGMFKRQADREGTPATPPEETADRTFKYAGARCPNPNEPPDA